MRLQTADAADRLRASTRSRHHFRNDSVVCDGRIGYRTMPSGTCCTTLGSWRSCICGSQQYAVELQNLDTRTASVPSSLGNFSHRASKSAQGKGCGDRGVIVNLGRPFSQGSQHRRCEQIKSNRRNAGGEFNLMLTVQWPDSCHPHLRADWERRDAIIGQHIVGDKSMRHTLELANSAAGRLKPWDFAQRTKACRYFLSHNKP
jgi:hypothetical protein